MKVLFAVSNENISTQIVKKYQKEYKEIISYKNVYYFNAIIKELQRDKSYDRIVISEDLEPFANNNNEDIEKFLFEKLDNISDEATGIDGEEIPIILLASDKRKKSETILVKLFGIGIYNILLGEDRTTQSVCDLLNKPRNKKDAKLYYKIEAEEVNYKSESEDNVSEVEIKNILNHYRKLGKDEERFIESFNNIAAQYNDAQLRIITKFLPLNVKAVLEEKSPKYQSVMTFSDVVSATELMKKKEEEEGLKIGYLNYTNTNKPTNPVIVPKAVKKVAVKKIIDEDLKSQEAINNNVIPDILNDFDDVVEEKIAKRGRGRPKKEVLESNVIKSNEVKRGRGRPRKIVEPIIDDEENILSGFENVEETTLPGFDNIEEDILPPGFDNIEEGILPGFDDIEETTLIEDDNKDTILPGFDEVEESILENTNIDEKLEKTEVVKDIHSKNNNYYENLNISNLISKDKKIISFVGTTKNGTSFIVNNLAKCLSLMGIKTAILDLTSNRNSYYIYTKNEESLRRVAFDSIRKLKDGIADGIQVDKNLDVYTALPGDKLPLEDVEGILSTLLQNYSIVLMDCDFNTPDEYFKVAQELYVVQTMDIFTIQPMTAFLRDLKAKNILKQEKIKIVINKEIKIRDLTPKVIIGGLSNYNDPAMSFMTELFNADMVKYITIPFDQEVCAKYLEGVMNCEVTIKGYSKLFNLKLKELANMVYPLVGSKNTFSSNMNNTLEQMKNKY